MAADMNTQDPNDIVIGEQNVSLGTVSDTAPAESNEIGSILAGKTHYAVGLTWQPLQSPDNPTPEVKEAIESDPDAAGYCLRITSTPQYGIGRKSLGHKPGDISAAAAIANAFIDKASACCVFKVTEGWYFVVIRNDLILSDNDTLYKSEEEALSAFLGMMTVPDWDIKIAPKEWGIEGTEERTFESVARMTRVKTRLEELNTTTRNSIFFILALFLLAILGLFLYLTFYFVKKISQEEQIEPLPIPEVIKPVEPAPEKPKPWEKIPQMHIFLNKCWNNAHQLQTLTIPGWQMGVATCTFQGLTTSWRPDSTWPATRVGWLKAALNEYKITRINVQISPDGSGATGSLTFHDIPLVASVPIYTPAQLQEELTDIKQATRLNIVFNRQSFLDPPDNEDGSKPENQQEFVYYSFSITSQYTPFEWLTFFKKFPGLELTKIEYNPSIDATDKWKYEGKIYAK